jgi:hypothetical protein
MTDTDDGRHLRRYLLGRLPEAESDELEVRLLAEPDVHQEMLAAEDDLVDDYALGRLDAADREAFEGLLLPRPGIGPRLAFARSLGAAAATEARTAAPAAARRPAGVPWSERAAAWLGGLMPAPALRLAAAAAAVVLVTAAGWSAWQGVELRRELATLEASQRELSGERAELVRRERELRGELAEARRVAAALAGSGNGERTAAAAQRIEELEGEVERLRRLPPPRREPVAVSYLLAMATRGSGVPELAVPEAADTVELQLETADAAYFDRFQVRVLGPGGAEAWSRTGLTADAEAGTVTAELPASVLAPGRYEVLLEGVGDGGGELLAAYELQVRRP